MLKKELSYEKEYDYVIVNKKLDDAIKQLIDIIKEESYEKA